jgi:hypothetical protein
MKSSLKTGLSFGLTSGVITTLGLMVGLHSGTHSRTVVIGGILTIAIADAMSDALGMHIAEESKNNGVVSEIWESTIATFVAKFLIALTFQLDDFVVDGHKVSYWQGCGVRYAAGRGRTTYHDMRGCGCSRALQWLVVVAGPLPALFSFFSDLVVL